MQEVKILGMETQDQGSCVNVCVCETNKDRERWLVVSCHFLCGLVKYLHAKCVCVCVNLVILL